MKLLGYQTGPQIQRLPKRLNKLSWIHATRIDHPTVRHLPRHLPRHLILPQKSIVLGTKPPLISIFNRSKYFGLGGSFRTAPGGFKAPDRYGVISIGGSIRISLLQTLPNDPSFRNHFQQYLSIQPHPWADSSSDFESPRRDGSSSSITLRNGLGLGFWVGFGTLMTQPIKWAGLGHGWVGPNQTQFLNTQLGLAVGCHRIETVTIWLR